MSILDDDETKPRGRGRPEFIVTDEHIMEAEILAGRGLIHKQIAEYWGISKITLARKARENPELWKALKKGRAKTVALVAGKLIEKIKDGDTASTIFYLRTQGRWKYADNENTKYEDDDIDENPEEMEINSDDPNEASKTYQYIMLKEVK